MATPTIAKVMALVLVCATAEGNSSWNGVCMENERRALLSFKKGLTDPSNRLSSWSAQGDCCQWAGVRCDNTTHHVVELHLGNPYGIDSHKMFKLGGKISPSLLELEYLTSLDLSYNDFVATTIPSFFGSMASLKCLNLSAATFAGEVPHQLGQLSRLRYLDLGYFGSLFAENLSWISGLHSLEYLDMSGVDLSKEVQWLQAVKMAGKGEGAKGDFMGLMQRASKGKRKEGAGEGSSPLVKRLRAPTPPVPPLVVEDIPIDKDPIFRPRWTIKRGDSGMPHANVSAQHLAHGVLPSDKLILENQPHEAFAMAHVQAAYNAYCYSSQMQERFSMAMDVARNAETDKRAAEAKAEKLDKEVKALKMENVDLLNKAGRFERRCEKLKQEKAEIGNKAINAFLDGTAGDEWLRRRTEDGLSIFQEGFQKAKELTTAKFPNIFLDDIVVPSFDSPSGETAAPVEVGDVVSPGEKSVRSGNAPPS